MPSVISPMTRVICSLDEDEQIRRSTPNLRRESWLKPGGYPAYTVFNPYLEPCIYC